MSLVDYIMIIVWGFILIVVIIPGTTYLISYSWYRGKNKANFEHLVKNFKTNYKNGE